jgi:hypothetical protein
LLGKGLRTVRLIRYHNSRRPLSHSRYIADIQSSE